MCTSGSGKDFSAIESIDCMNILISRSSTSIVFCIMDPPKKGTHVMEALVFISLLPFHKLLCLFVFFIFFYKRMKTSTLSLNIVQSGKNLQDNSQFAYDIIILIWGKWMTLLNNKKICKASDFHFLGRGGVGGMEIKWSVTDHYNTIYWWSIWLFLHLI